MTVATQEFLARLRSLDIHLAVEGERLRVNAPKGAITPALQQELSARKTELLAWMQQMRWPAIAPVPRAPNMPLSISQMSLWKSIQMAPDTARFNMHLAFQVQGALDVHALGRSLNEIVRRHETLRTAIVLHEGEPAQRIQPFTPFALPVEPCAHEQAMQARLHRFITEPFDLQAGHLHRFALLQRDENTHVLALALHHIIADGWSWDVMLRELHALYGAFRAEQPSPLPALPVQYADYAMWQRELLNGARLDVLREFWSAQLAPPPQPLAFLRAGRAQESLQVRLALDAENLARIAACAQQHHVTPFAVHLAAFFAALRARSGQDDVVVCTPAACRTVTAVEPLIGYFNNLLPLRLRAGDLTFRAWLVQLQETLHAAMEHQALPFDAIAALPGASQVSLARAVFSMQGDAGWTLALDGLAVKRIPLDNALAVFDLFMTLDATQDEAAALLEYRADALDATEAHALLHTYEGALRALVAQPDQAITDWAKQAGAPATAPQHERPAYAPPCTPAQRQLVALWETHFNRAPIGIHDDFFALGGNSLLAFRLFGQIARDMHANLPLATLYQHTTVERLAAVIEQQPAHRAWSSLVAIQPHGDRPPFFGIHGQDGNVLFWRHLVKHLHPDQPFYGIQARGVDGYSKPLSRIEDMAARYLSEVQQAQPAGPYYLGGFSMGGEIAFEMAQRIVAQGGKVNLLVLFDTSNPDRPVRKPATASPDVAESHVSIVDATPANRFDMLQRKLMNHVRRLSAMPPREQARYLMNDLGMRAKRARLRSASALYRRLGRRLPPSILQPYLSSVHMEAVLNYLPQPYAGRVTLFRSKPTLISSPLNSPMGWEPLACGGLDLHLFDATHRLIDEEYAEVVGKRLQSCLDMAQMPCR